MHESGIHPRLKQCKIYSDLLGFNGVITDGKLPPFYTALLFFTKTDMTQHN